MGFFSKKKVDSRGKIEYAYLDNSDIWGLKPENELTNDYKTDEFVFKNHESLEEFIIRTHGKHMLSKFPKISVFELWGAYWYNDDDILYSGKNELMTKLLINDAFRLNSHLFFKLNRTSDGYFKSVDFKWNDIRSDLNVFMAENFGGFDEKQLLEYKRCILLLAEQTRRSKLRLEQNVKRHEEETALAREKGNQLVKKMRSLK